MPEERKPKEVSFELTRAEFLKPEERVQHNLPTEGLVVKEKIAHSYPNIQLHFIGSDGIVKFMKKLESEG